MIRNVDIVKSVIKRITSKLSSDYQVHALNAIKRDFKIEDKKIYVLVDEVTRQTVYQYYEEKIVMIRIFFKIHDKNNYAYYDFVDDMRYKVFNDVVTIDPKLNNPDSEEPIRKLMPYDWVCLPNDKICEISFNFRFQDIFRYDTTRNTAEVLKIKEE
jgi:hypothetical protein